MVTPSFVDQVNDPEKSAIYDLSHPGKPLLIVFGGIGGLPFQLPTFEFLKLTNDLKVNKIYTRDLRQSWYHAGLPGISKNIDETAIFLKGKVQEANPNKVVVIGNSSGAFAAILFGVLIQADVVDAFAPQTIIKDSKLVRNKRRVHEVHRYFESKYFDLLDTIQSAQSPCRINLYYDVESNLDRFHASRLEALPNVTLHRFRGGGHRLVRKLRRTGRLYDIIAQSLKDTEDSTANESDKYLDTKNESEIELVPINLHESLLDLARKPILKFLKRYY